MKTATLGEGIVDKTTPEEFFGVVLYGPNGEKHLVVKWLTVYGAQGYAKSFNSWPKPGWKAEIISLGYPVSSEVMASE